MPRIFASQWVYYYETICISCLLITTLIRGHPSRRHNRNNDLDHLRYHHPPFLRNAEFGLPSDNRIYGFFPTSSPELLFDVSSYAPGINGFNRPGGYVPRRRTLSAKERRMLLARSVCRCGVSPDFNRSNVSVFVWEF